MDEEQVRKIVEEATAKAVEQTLVSLGIDTSQPLDMQQHMAALRELSALLEDEDYKADQIHLRKWRKSMESASKIGFKTVVTMIFTGIVTAIALGFSQMWFGGGGNP